MDPFTMDPFTMDPPEWRPLDPPLPPLFEPRHDQHSEPQPLKPLSPWAQRFGVEDIGHDAVFERASEQKSGLAPERKSSSPPPSHKYRHRTLRWVVFEPVNFDPSTPLGWHIKYTGSRSLTGGS